MVELLGTGAASSGAMTEKGSFVKDIKEIRRRAREHMEQAAVTKDYSLDRDTAIRLLNEAVATEIVCTLRYKWHAAMAKGISSESVKAEFLEHAAEETQHADWLVERITQLDGTPNLNPEGLAQRSNAEFIEVESLIDMIKENLVAERIAIETYRDMARFFGDKDPTSRILIEKILAKEEEHANDMADLMSAHSPQDDKAEKDQAKSKEQPAQNGRAAH